jgi:hypothetical protein
MYSNLMRKLREKKLWPLSEAIYGTKGRAALFGSVGGVLVGVMVGVFVIAGSQQRSSLPQPDLSSTPTSPITPLPAKPSPEAKKESEPAAPGMKIYKYKVVPSIALEFYEENGMTLDFDPELVNGVLSIEAPDRPTADLIRMTYTDITMWEKAED